MSAVYEAIERNAAIRAHNILTGVVVESAQTAETMLRVARIAVELMRERPETRPASESERGESEEIRRLVEFLQGPPGSEDAAESVVSA
jgi:hypothetical protein